MSWYSAGTPFSAYTIIWQKTALNEGPGLSCYLPRHATHHSLKRQSESTTTKLFSECFAQEQLAKILISQAKPASRRLAFYCARHRLAQATPATCMQLQDQQLLCKGADINFPAVASLKLPPAGVNSPRPAWVHPLPSSNGPGALPQDGTTAAPLCCDAGARSSGFLWGVGAGDAAGAARGGKERRIPLG